MIDTFTYDGKTKVQVEDGTMSYISSQTANKTWKII